MQAPTVPTVELNNGVSFPLLSLGMASLVETPGRDKATHESFRGMLPERCYRQMENALSKGVRSFDTAYVYRSHGPMGHVLGEWFRSGKLEKRSEVFITTKVFHPSVPKMLFDSTTLKDMHTLTPEEVSTKVRHCFEMSLRELNLGYVDCLLLHWPSGVEGSVEGNRKLRIAAWKLLEEFYECGWARAIGVSNFSPKHLEDLKADGAIITPMVNQFEASVTLQYRDILNYCKVKNILPQAHSPFGIGINNMPGIVKILAQKYEKDTGQIILRYLIQLGYAITFFTQSEARMESNNDIFDFKLDEEDMTLLNAENNKDGGKGLPSPMDLP